MACGCSSSPSTYTSSNVVSNGCGVPSCNCNLPRRSSIPPVVPVLWKDAARFRQMSAGVLVVHCGEEMGSLDSPIDGFVKFDAATGKVYVTGSSTEYVVDYFACTNDQIFGFPLYGVKPECRDMGENPDRRVAIVRPPNSAYGIVYGHEQTCAPLTGLKPEITPVQIVPDPLPDPIPTGIQSFTWVAVPPGEDCSGPKRHYYEVPGEHISSVDGPNIRNWSVPATLESESEQFGFAAWLYNESNTKWELQKVSNESMLDMIGANSSPVHLLDAPERIYVQNRSVGGVPYGSENFMPALPPPGPMPIVQDVITVDLTTIAGWDPAFKGVIIATRVGISCLGAGLQNLSVYVTIDGVDHVGVGVNDFTGEVAMNDNEKIVKFNPATKVIQINLRKFDVGTTDAIWMFAAVYIVGFVK
jgi:hypothetical protein